EALRQERVAEVLAVVPEILLVFWQLGGRLAIAAGHEEVPVPPGREGARAEAMLDERRVLGMPDDLEALAHPQGTPAAPVLHVGIRPRGLPRVRLAGQLVMVAPWEVRRVGRHWIFGDRDEHAVPQMARDFVEQSAG